MARTATVATAFLSTAALAELQGTALNHRLSDGSIVRCEPTMDTASGYVMARIVEGPLKFRTVRLDARTRVSAIPLGALGSCGPEAEGADSREVNNLRTVLRNARHRAAMREPGTPAWIVKSDAVAVEMLQNELAEALLVQYAAAAA